MTTEGVTRKLTAILSADVKDDSRLMGQDDVGTICTLTSCDEAMGILIRRYRGWVADATGDNVLARFGRALNAVNCALRCSESSCREMRNSPITAGWRSARE